MSETETIPIHGRDVEVKTLNETQKMLIIREAQVLRSKRQETDRKMHAVATILNIVETVIVDGDDREYFLDLAANGTIEFGEMLKIAMAFEEEAEPVKAVATVRRAARKR